LQNFTDTGRPMQSWKASEKAMQKSELKRAVDKEVYQDRLSSDWEHGPRQTGRWMTVSSQMSRAFDWGSARPFRVVVGPPGINA
jgi:hypothetical protein